LSIGSCYFLIKFFAGLDKLRWRVYDIHDSGQGVSLLSPCPVSLCTHGVESKKALAWTCNPCLGFLRVRRAAKVNNYILKTMYAFPLVYICHDVMTYL